LARVRASLCAQYVDHNLTQEDSRNPDDHLYLQSAAKRFGLWFSRPGNGVSHPVHMERFGVPGATLLGSDSHTPAAGSLGMLAIGAGGLEVALAMAGEPYYFTMPEVWGVRLTGTLPDWVSAKDVILEMLRRHGVTGGVGRILEYFGPGLEQLTAMDRHVIANMGAELGATSTVFPSDNQTRRFLRQQEREGDWLEMKADDGAEYDCEEEIELGSLEPLIACPGSPANVVAVRDVAGRPIYQSYLGSSANPGLRDFAVPAMMVANRHIAESVSFDVNPTSRQILENLLEQGHLGSLIASGARLHQAGCNGCIGMGQAPATDGISLRTVPRNFPGRSGARDDLVYLCSPETVAASALTGRITDPRTLGMEYPRYREPDRLLLNRRMIVPPAMEESAAALIKGPNIKALPEFGPFPDTVQGPALLKVGDDVSTDAILPAGAKVLPYRSNVPKISEFVFRDEDPGYAKRALAHRERGSFILAGHNYGQGSSREHAALAPRYLGLRAVIAKSFARIHRQNLINVGVLPLRLVDPDDFDRIDRDAELHLEDLHRVLAQERVVGVRIGNGGKAGRTVRTEHGLSPRQAAILLAGGLINHFGNRATRVPTTADTS
jgi:aconitate hydratase